MRPARVTPLAALAGAVLAAAGCGAPPPPKRGPISGTVTLDGKPAARANVRFIALDPNGANVLARVTNGTYDVPAAEGPTKGKYRVEFSVPAAATRKTRNPDNPLEWLEEPQETLPPRYHRDSEFVMDYDPDAPKPYDAALTSK